MNLEFIITFLVLDGLAWLGFIVIHKNINHVTNSHIRILGVENKSLVKTKTLFVVRFLYFTLLLFISIGCMYFVLNY